MISVILSTFNNEEYLESAIKSILNQTYTNFEFIVIDDASNDETGKILNRYKKIDTRIKVFRNIKNLGLTKSLNIAIKNATGEFLARMDDDDISISDRFESQLAEFKKNPKLMVLGGSIKRIDEKNDYLDNTLINFSNNFSDTKFVSKYFNPIAHPTAMIRKELFNHIELYDERYRSSQDFDLWKRVIEKNFQIYSLKKHVLNYRIHNSSVSIKDNASQSLNFLKIKHSIDNNFISLEDIELELMKAPTDIKNNINLYNELKRIVNCNKIMMNNDYILYLTELDLSISKKTVNAFLKSKKIDKYTKVFAVLRLTKKAFLGKKFILASYCLLLAFKTSVVSVIKVYYLRNLLNEK